LIKIFKYELKRLIINKFFLILLAVTLIYSFMTLRGNIILGVAYTAPFSSWSYGAYLAGVLPLLLTAMLFFMTFLYSASEKPVKPLTFATPTDPGKYTLVKCAAMAAGYVIISLSVIALSLVFYGTVFRFYGFGAFLIPILLTLLPAMLFIMGVGLLAGGLQPNIIYAVMAATLIIGSLPLPAFIDLFGSRFFSEYPLTLPLGPDGEPAFSVPVSFVLGKILFGLSGIMMIFAGTRSFYVKNQ